MKKLIALLAVVLVLTGCSSAAPNNPDDNSNDNASVVLKAGVGSYTTVSAKDVTDGTGSMEVVTTYAAVAVDGEGIIKYVHFDTAQNNASVDGEGKVAIEAKATKRELGENYGMAKYANTIEWDKQIAHLESKLVGMNIEDAVNMELDEKNKSLNEDVLSGCTIGLNEFVMALDTASKNLAEAEGAVKAYAGSDTSVSKKDVADGKGSAEVATTFGLALTDAQDKVVFAYFDTVQHTGNVDAEGKITLETTSTKKELGENYGMSKWANTTEWDKQIAHLESTMIGKTVADFTGAQLDEAGKSVDADVLSGCTVHISEFVALLNKAFVSEIK